MKPIVTDTYDFPTLVGNGYVYVDKTALLRRMISGVDGRFFFMSRPRRFGKSLMISTLEQIFKGNRGLFRGLAIAKSNYDWKPYPVIRLDMSAFDSTGGAQVVGRDLLVAIAEQMRAVGLEIPKVESPGMLMGLLIDGLRKQSPEGKVVVLVDEYDSPISGLLNRPAELERMRSLLQSFYRVLKSNAGNIHFLMMTGVSKFTKLSVFSGMNNLTDISMSPVYAALLGYTRTELEQVFKPHVKAFAVKLKKSPEAVVREILAWYDSYRFSPESNVRVCNPVSVGRALQERRFYGFWDATGSATLIVERLRKLGKLPDEIDGIRVFPKKLDVCDARTLPFAALMYQGGYLTIKDVDPNGELILGIPNREVRLSIYDGLVDMLLADSADSFTSAAVNLKRVLDEGDSAEPIGRVLKSVFAMVPHEWKLRGEAEAKRYFLLFMKMSGAAINAEVESSNGRADAILETGKAVFIFEFKYGKSAKAALKQCHSRNYAAPYAADRRRIVYVGVNYDTLKRNVDTLNDTLNDALNDTLNSRLLSLVRQRPGLRRPDLMAALNVSESTVARCLREMRTQVGFRGPSKTGGYYVK